MKTMFKALEADDFPKLAELLAPDFYSFDGGHRFEGMALPEFVKKAHAEGMVFHWSVTKPDVHLCKDIAWITYENVGAVGNANGMRPQIWMESAIVRRHRGQWQVKFLHSTRAARS